VKSTLLCNGISAKKITVCRQGFHEQSVQSETQLKQLRSQLPSPLKIALLGRLDATKGVHILIEALRSIPDAPLRLDIYGVGQGEQGMRYEQNLRRLAAMDERIRFHSPVPSCDVITMLRNYDILAVPSQWLETGPLVILEAFAAGIPVIGSRRGGISELVRDGIDGILVEAGDLRAWSNVLLRLSGDRSVLHALSQNIRPPRTMTAVAREMAELYQQIAGHSFQHRLPAKACSR
jgi:glycosyltransferase involved in cell wall biosynthesis